MNPTDPTPLDTLLDDSIEAAREVDDYALADAARRFRNRLPQARPRRSPVASWFRVAGVAALLVLAVGLAPLLLPGKPGASAFAEARAWFEQYETLQFEMKTSRDGQVLSTVRVWSDESGATRIETPPITH
ncbi:MAG: hypothetical protein V2I57_09215, partial [Xanthomonadales bacterium]|nr:hypothetical protein [Xanthomonadales bacterium]